MDIDDVLRYAPILIIALGIFYLWLRYRARESTLNLPLETLGLIVEVSAFGFVIFLIERYYYVEHNYFTLAIILFVPIWTAYTYWLLKKDDVYILVSSLQGDKFKDLETLEVKASSETSQRLLIMSREVYEGKRHVGDLSYPFWRGTSRLHFADKFDDKSGTFFHHEDARLKNVSFYIAKSYWLKLREDMPRVIRENVLLTWLSEYNLAHKQRVLADRFKLHLRALERQHRHEPFAFPDDLDELFEYLKNESARGLSESEESQEKGQGSIEPKEVKE